MNSAFVKFEAYVLVSWNNDYFGNEWCSIDSYSMYCIWYFLQSVIISLAHAVMHRRRRMCLNHVPRVWNSILSWIGMSLSPCSRMQATAHAPEMKYPLVIETIVIAIFIKQEKSAKLQNIKNHTATYFSSLLKVHQKTICFHTQDSLCT